MSSGRYWLTRSAEEDLIDIAKYTLEIWGEEQLEIYRLRLEKRLALLVDFPELGRNHPMLHVNIQYVVEGRHYIFYRRAGAVRNDDHGLHVSHPLPAISDARGFQNAFLPGITARGQYL